MVVEIITSSKLDHGYAKSKLMNWFLPNQCTGFMETPSDQTPLDPIHNFHNQLPRFCHRRCLSADCAGTKPQGLQKKPAAHGLDGFDVFIQNDFFHGFHMLSFCGQMICLQWTRTCLKLLPRHPARQHRAAGAAAKRVKQYITLPLHDKNVHIYEQFCISDLQV